MISITQDKEHGMNKKHMRKKTQSLEKLCAIVFALIIWQITALWIGQEILLVSPVRVIWRLFGLCAEGAFWNSIVFSCIRILSGCLLAMVTGILLAVVSSRFRLVEILLWPFLSAIKATPVASFIILCLIWFRAESLSTLMSFLMVLPLIYANMLQGIRGTDKKLLEMAGIFQLRIWKRILYIYTPEIMPYMISASSVAIGMSWKAGIAAEVIGIPNGSIGEMLYQAKVYLNSADLFAWTVVIIVLSILVEKGFLMLLRTGYKRLEKM